ncbi:hypothetical protein ABBQ32_011286 [Trebouxia sp. C0010 RCD-2024]
MRCAARASILQAYWRPSAAQGVRRICRGHGRNTATDRMREAATSAHASGERGAGDGNQHACNIDSHLSKEGQARNLSSLSKFIFSFLGIPGMVSLHGGLPNASIFPFKSMKVELQDGTWLDMSETEKMDAAQQYNTNGRGYPPLLEWAKQNAQQLHAPPARQEVVITSGNNHAIDMVLCCLLNRGDSLLCDEYTYSHLVEAMVGPKGYRALPVPMDDFGMTPEALEQTIEDLKAKGQPLPRVLYLVPNGQNPVSYVAPLERRQALYQTSRKYDLMIVEDDPYFFLQFPHNREVPGLWNMGRSYMSLDTDGRVVRLDSFAKFLAPGFRLGWLTAHPHFVDKFTYHMHGTALGPCSTTQVMLAELVQHWGSAGLDRHLKSLQTVYKRRALLMHTAAKQHLEGLASWLPPEAGMFMWLKLEGGVKDADDIIDALKDEQVAVVPGRISHCNGPRPPFPCPFVRLSFAMAPEEDIPKGIERLANVLKRVQNKSDRGH